MAMALPAMKFGDELRVSHQLVEHLGVAWANVIARLWKEQVTTASKRLRASGSVPLESAIAPPLDLFRKR